MNKASDWQNCMLEGNILTFNDADKPVEYTYDCGNNYETVFSLYNPYTVTYKVNGEYYAEQTYDYAAAVIPPDYPVPEGYTFSGWDVPETMPAENLVLDASLTINRYVIMYYVNTEYYAEQTYDYGAAVRPPYYTAPEGYVFSGWNVPATMPARNLFLNGELTLGQYKITYSINGEFYAEQTYYYGAAVTAPDYTVPEEHAFSGWDVPETMPAENLVLDASLTVNQYKITYNINDEFYAEQTYDYGAAVTAPDYAVPEGYAFSGWDIPETMPAENLVLNALLTVNQYKITYNINGEFYAEQTYDYGAAAAAPEYTVPEGHTFSGWDVPETMPAENLVLDAVLTVNTYTVTFCRNDGSGEIFAVLYDVEFGTTIDEPSPEPVLYGYRFDGWYRSDMVTEWDFAADTVTADLNLYARWTKLYNVNFNPGGGTLPEGADEPEQASLAQGETFIIPECPYEKTGYTFVCWYDGINEYHPGDTYTIPGNDVTLTAVWENNILPGDYDCNGVVDMADALMTLRAAMMIETPSAQSLLNADIDGDGVLTTSDALYILRMAMHVI